MNYREQITEIDNGLSVLAPAKINLSLLIAGKRPDGYHEIETIMAKVNFFDEVLIQQGRKAGIELICEGPQWAPDGEDNLVYRAAILFLAHCGIQADISITLTKNIPAGSGLGSASSDAAATLIGLDRFFKTKLHHEVLATLAAQLGSDVAFFLNGPLALCRGRGEKIEKIEEKYDFLTLLLLPDISVSTKMVYTNYKHEQGLYERLSSDINGYINKNRIDFASKMCANMLEKVCFDLVKSLAELKKSVESLGIKPCCLSGSGSAMFCIIDKNDEEKARQYQYKLEENIDCKSIIVSNIRW
jgi:4-diphosphocytidyl-2-C-methyl-D-erythritol kinase